MKITILGAAGFIGTNLTLALAKNLQNTISIVDENEYFFSKDIRLPNVNIKILDFRADTDFNTVLQGQDQVYHLISTNNPSTSNQNISSEITDNISISINILDACVRHKIKKIVFISSGGTVYGNANAYPVGENCSTNPITTYGIQKLTIEKLLYLYNYIYGLDYVVLRLSNPYGPYQRPNGRLGVITNFLFKALHNEKLIVYGNGNVVRDYIFIDDTVRYIIKAAEESTTEKIFNLGSGIGLSINEIIDLVSMTIGNEIRVEYIENRSVDLPVNYLDISKYQIYFGSMEFTPIELGMKNTLDYLRNNY